uniref:Glycosylated lysosomal membrane protein n=1 Tax=Amphilophus citrinellus TaxID=61819 RepID=A0A3Q0RF85_AMPCI
HSFSSSVVQLFIQVNPGSNSTPPLGDLLHVRAVGDNDTLHFLFCSQGAPTLLFVHTNSSSSNVQVNWTQFLAPNTNGSLKVEPESSVLYSSAIVFSRLLEYDDVNNTAEPTSEFFPPYDLQNFTWNHLNLSGHTALLCGADASFTNGSLCLQVCLFDSEGRSQSLPHLLHSVNSSQLELRLDGVPARAAQSRFLLELQAVGGAYPLSRMEVHESIDDEYTPSIFKVTVSLHAVRHVFLPRLVCLLGGNHPGLDSQHTPEQKPRTGMLSQHTVQNEQIDN